MIVLVLSLYAPDLGAPNQAVHGNLARLTDRAEGSCQIFVRIFPQL